LIFLFFFPVTALIYFLLPNLRLRNLFLLFASYYFYMNWNPRYAILIAAVTGITYTSSLLLEKWSSAGRRKAVAAICIVLILLVLFTYKYLGFAADVISGVLRSSGLAVKIPEFSILLPVGISFFSFQSIGYLVDVYRRTIPAERDFFTYALFVSFFPQLVAGPIERANNLLPQFKIMHPFSPDQVLEGIRMMLWGYFLKLCVAERIAPYVDAVFNNYLFHNGNSLALGTFFFTFQIYGDFCGYSLIACGTSRCLGFRLMQNFAHPYFAESIRDFWRRWHISLSFWTRDYIFFAVAMSKPIGRFGKKCRQVLGDRIGKLIPVFIGQICVFMIIGLWHGAEFKYVAYGLYNGGIIILSLLLEPYFKKAIEKLKINVESKLWKVFQILRTFCIVTWGRMFPKAASFGVAISMYASIFRPFDVPFREAVLTLGLNNGDFLVILLACLVWFFISWNQEKGVKIREALDEKPVLLRWAVYLLGFAAVLIFGIYGPGYDASAFIYRGF
jgi:D-alanyl-lipoteichoic acid acyltransferase DltB (MBOAT superfamily)